MSGHPAGVLGAFSLFVLPGSWIAFAGRKATPPFRVRLSLAVILSALVVVLEFYLLRWSGLAFDTTTDLLPLVNLPAAYLVWRAGRGVTLPDVRSMLLWSAACLPVAAYLWLWMGNAFVRANWQHAWTHADIVYMLANGQLRLEEPQLAGVRLAYPWMSHVFQATISFLLNASPNSSYLLTNVIWLIAVIVLVAAVVESLGGNRLAQVMSAVLLPFGANWAGYVAARLVPAGLRESYGVWGDPRYTPWLRKFGIFEPTIFGISVFAALTFILIRDTEEPPGLYWLAVVGALTLAAALLYPILCPASLALLAARASVLVAKRVSRNDVSVRREITALVAFLVVGTLMLGAYVSLITVDQAGAATFGLSSAPGIRAKVATSVIVLAPLLLGFAFAARRSWRLHAESFGLLVLGAAASIVAYIGLDIYFVSNEYKYMFAAALCLTPLASLALGDLLSRMGRAGLPVAVAISLVLVLPALHRVRAGKPDSGGWRRVETGQFDLRLATRERYAGLTDAIRTLTPLDAVVVSRATPFDLVTVTRRAVYVPFDTGYVHGVGLTADYLLKKSRGYSAALIDRRRESLRQVFAGHDGIARQQALRRIVTDLGRPIVVVVRRAEDAELADWFESSANERMIFSGTTEAAWLVTGRSPVTTSDDASSRRK